MRSKLISIGAIVILIIVSTITVVYFTSQNKGDEILVSSEPTTSLVEPEITLDSSILAPLEEKSNYISGWKNNWNPDDILLKEGLTFVKMNEPLTLHSRYYAQGEVRDEQTLNLSWDGDLIFTVKKAQLFDYVENDSQEWSSRLDEHNNGMDFKNPAVLLIEIELENVDATQNFGISDEFHMNFYLQSKLFYSQALAVPGSIDPLMEYIGGEPYFSAHADGKDYYTFNLPQGEVITFQYAFLISREILDYPPLYFNPIGSSTTAYCGIELDQIEKE